MLLLLGVICGIFSELAVRNSKHDRQNQTIGRWGENWTELTHHYRQFDPYT
jgi:hypothetical protein